MKNEKIEPLKPDTLTKISQSIIANQIAYDFNHEIKFTPYFKHELKMRMTPVITLLQKAELEEYDKFFGLAERAASDTYAAMTKMINEISSAGLFEFDNIAELVKAYKTDPKSVMGIAKKINRK